MGYRVMVAVLVLVTTYGLARADAPALPLSQYGSLAWPELRLKELAPHVRTAIEAALTAAETGRARALAAEAVEKRAMASAAKGRAAARSARWTGKALLNVSFAGAVCRYAGQIENHRAQGSGVMLCGTRKFEGEFESGKPSGLVVAEEPGGVYLGQYRDGAKNGLGGDYSRKTADAYEGEYRAGARSGFGVERDKDGTYPGRFGPALDDKGERIAMELLGLQDFKDTHWAGRYGFYAGPKIACSVIQGAVLEGSVLDGYGAKFDARGRVIEQGLYRLGRLTGSSAPPC